MNATLWAVLAVIGTAIAGPVAVRLVAWLLELKSRLVVTVGVHQSFQMPSVYEEFWKLVPRPSTIGEPSDEYFRMSSKLRTICNSENYVRFELKNNSSKKLSALTFCAHSVSNAFVQIGSGELVEIKSDVPMPLGELQPKREMVVHLLGGSLWNANTPKDIKKSMVFSADELGSVTYKFPLPFYQKMRMMNKVSSFSYWIFGALLLATIIATLWTVHFVFTS